MEVCEPVSKSEQVKFPKIDFEKPVLVYDGDCGFCAIWINYWKRITGERVGYAPLQSFSSKNFRGIPTEEFQKSVKLILPEGEIFSGAHAVFQALSLGGKNLWLWIYEHIPGVKPISEFSYNFIANRRRAFYGVTAFLFGVNIVPASYTLVSALFLKFLGAIYLIAFASFGVQILGLIGSSGISPVWQYLQAAKASYGAQAYFLAPTVFWLNSSDAFLKIVCILGALFSLALIFGIIPRTSLIILFILYLSITVGGQVFMQFQWDALLLETGFLAILLSFAPAQKLAVWAFRILLFKLMFLSGAVKFLSRDQSWRDGTALTYHYETQPLPTLLSWYIHKMPLWFHKISLWFSHFVELVVPFFAFGTRNLRLFAGGAFVIHQLLIFLTGNYTFFNLLTIGLAIFLLDDQLIRDHLPGKFVGFLENGSSGIIPVLSTHIVPVLLIAISILSLLTIVLNFENRRVGKLFKPLEWIAPFRIVNSYGLFAVMTKSRPEIIIEGSNDGQDWRVYEFKYKPGNLSRPPIWVQPHQPRLDWQMWFAALGNYQQNPWFINLAQRLLENSKPVLNLLKSNPFPDAPPRFIRSNLYDYHFTSFPERKISNNWWKRSEIGSYLPQASLKEQ